MNFKIGTGFDVHRFAEGRKLFLGGIEIPFEKGLLGHSDADVLLHAICDALLGAVGKGDIGDHFPDTDEKYKDISSSVLLERVYNLVQDEGYRVSNLDAIVHAEEPKLKKFKSAMCFHIAYKLAVDEDCINVKATTHEGLGFVGAKEGIAASASVLLVKDDNH